MDYYEGIDSMLTTKGKCYSKIDAREHIEWGSPVNRAYHVMYHVIFFAGVKTGQGEAIFSLFFFQSRSFFLSVALFLSISLLLLDCVILIHRRCNEQRRLLALFLPPFPGSSIIRSYDIYVPSLAIHLSNSPIVSFSTLLT